jgi:exopolysaccharide production protein ExoZ
MKTLHSIQYLRGLAAMLVVFHHVLLQLDRHGSGLLELSTPVGQSGVDIFFVISGFIMTVTTYGREVTPLQFFAKRVIRVVPVYWFYTIAMVVITLLMPELLHTAQYELAHAIKSLLFIPEYHPRNSSEIWPVLVQGWTLNFEMFFYIIFGASLLIRDTQLRLWAMVLILGSLALTGFLVDFQNPIVISYTSELLLEFAGGCVIGYLYAKQQLPRWHLAFLLLAFAGFYLSIIAPGWSTSRLVVWGIPAMLLVSGCVSYENAHGVRKLKVLHWLGDSSYSTYLSHSFVLGLLGAVWGKLGVSNMLIDFVAFTVGLVASAVIGFVSYLLIENVSRRWLTGLLFSTVKR